MARALRPALVLIASAVLSAAGPDTPLPPRCGPETRGDAVCMAGDTCTCDYWRGGSITAEPAGWRWNCAIERMCGDPPPADNGARSLPPDTLVSPQLSLPSGSPLLRGFPQGGG